MVFIDFENDSFMHIYRNIYIYNIYIFICIGDVASHPERYDINFCPPGGKAAARDQTLLKPGNEKISIFGKAQTGERDWLHVNSASYCPIRDQIMLSLNVPSEIIIVDHSTTMVRLQFLFYLSYHYVHPTILYCTILYHAIPCHTIFMYHFTR